MAGKFIVVEGVNCAGKTTAIKSALELLAEEDDGSVVGSVAGSVVYSKGFTKDNLWGEFINSHPTSFAYYLDFTLKSKMQIKPMLEKGKIVVQDRYVQSVDSYLPDSLWLHNKLVRKYFSPFFIKPDVYIYFRCDTVELAKRLSGAKDDYRLGLSKDPQKLLARDMVYMDIYNALDCKKHILDTSNKSPAECADELINLLRRYVK